MTTFAKKVLLVCVTLFMINAVGMWTVLYLEHTKLEAMRVWQEAFDAQANQPNTQGSSRSPDMKSTSAGVEERVTRLEAEQFDQEKRLDSLESSVSALKKNPTKTSSSTNTSGSSVVTSQGQKEYTIYLGEGSSANREWATIQATTIALDTNKYQHIKAVYFETALSIVGGEAYAQLVSADSGNVVSAQLMNNTQTPTWKSTTVSLHSGSQLYVVQMKSSSGELATLSGARLRIIAD